MSLAKIHLKVFTVLEIRDKYYGQTPLSWAGEKGHLEVVKLLLGAGAKVDSKDDRYGQTPLSWAAENGHLEVVKLLLGAGANVNSKDDKYGRTPLSWAGYHGHLEVVKWLVLRGVPDITSDEYYVNALQAASIEGHETVMRLFLDNGTRFVWTNEERSKVCHERVSCDACHGRPIRGIRYKCKSCDDYDLCERCFENRETIHSEHKMFLDLPVQDPHAMLSKLGEDKDAVVQEKTPKKEE